MELDTVDGKSVDKKSDMEHIGMGNATHCTATSLHQAMSAQVVSEKFERILQILLLYKYVFAPQMVLNVRYSI